LRFVFSNPLAVINGIGRFGLGLVDLTVAIDGPDIFRCPTRFERADHPHRQAPKEQPPRLGPENRTNLVARRLRRSRTDRRYETVVAGVELIEAGAFVMQKSCKRLQNLTGD
jgi:hypothetical protein